MGRETRLFKSRETKRREEIGDFLRQLADRIADGRVTLSQGGEDIVLQLPQSLVLEVQVEDEEKGQKGTQHSLELEFKWFDRESGEQAGPLELK
jgi:amphi-Trp domain-containing protein